MASILLATVGVLGLLAGCDRSASSLAQLPDLTSSALDFASDLQVAQDLGPTADLSGPQDLGPIGDLAHEAKTVTVVIGQGGLYMFVPAARTINVGDTVRWLAASDGHFVFSGADSTPDGKFCSPDNMGCLDPPLFMVTPSIDSGQTYTHTFKAPGTYPYFCFAHAETGTIFVR